MGIRTVRKIVLVAVLLGGVSMTAPADVSAMCVGYYLDSQNYSGQCAPGGVDACGYYRSECDYYCFTHYSGGLCWNEFLLCDQYVTGPPWDPQYCIDDALCNCWYDYY